MRFHVLTIENEHFKGHLAHGIFEAFSHCPISFAPFLNTVLLPPFLSLLPSALASAFS